MFFLLIVLTVADLTLASESDQDTSAANVHGEKRMKSTQGALGFYAALTNHPVLLNKTFFEKEENSIRVPSTFFEERKKKKKPKRSPKRTIQKIIKKGKNKSRKIYVHPITRVTVKPSERITKDFYTKRAEEMPTEKSHRRKMKKNSKVVRYPMPFHQYRKDPFGRKRTRRDIDDNQIQILNDLDETEFLSNEKDNIVVKAHIQHHW